MYPRAIEIAYVFIGLTLLGSLSPLLTVARLWQMKEWRTDRLRDHLVKEGIFPQLFGRVRPAVLVLAALLFAFDLQNETPTMPVLQWAGGVITALALLSALQIILRRQPKPVWTQKAMLLCLTSFLLTGAAAYGATELGTSDFRFLLLTPIPLLQPIFLALSWLIFLPLDQFLKQRILGKARSIRAQNPDLTVIGVTGSVGKTTTKELLNCVLQDFHPLTTPAHVNSEMGVAQWMIRELSSQNSPPPRLLIVEMGAYRGGEIALLSSIVKQTIAVLTFIGNQHVALFGSRQALVKAKAEILTTLPQNGHAFLNGDSEAIVPLKDITPCPVTMIGTGSGVDLLATDIEETPSGIRFTAGQTIFDVPVHGTHNVTNVLLTIAVGQHMGMTLPSIAKKLQSFTSPKQTFEVRQEGGVRILDDTHNASSTSFQAAIEWAKSQPAAEKVLLTSGIIELGEEEERLHAELGAQAASVFQRAVFTQERSLGAFTRGFGRSVEMLGRNAVRPVSKDALLVCIGRMSPQTIRRFLPSA